MTPTNLDPGAPGNQLAQATSNTLAAVQLQVNQWNAQLIADYNIKHNNWSETEINHPGSQPEPMPPMAWVIGHFTDPTTGPGTVGVYGETPMQWATPMRSDHPVCAPLPGPVLNTAPTPKTADGGLMGALVAEGGKALEASRFNASIPLVGQVTASDGTVWMRVK